MVFRGTQPSVGRDVAVKVIRAELANRPEFVRRFEAEAHLVASLEHPHVVPLYDYWREPDRAYLVLRYLRGGTLEANLADGRGLPLEQVRTLVTAGRLGAGRRPPGRRRPPRRASRPTSSSTTTATSTSATSASRSTAPTSPTRRPPLSAGSPRPTPRPSSCAGSRSARRPTCTGWAITVYEALTGRAALPRAARPTPTSLQRQLNEPIPAVRLAAAATCPAAVDDVLARATAKSPPDRFERVEDFVAAFVAALDGGAAPAPARPSAPRSTVMADLEARNPYKGLRPFSEADAADFRGRARLVDRLVANAVAPRPVGPAWRSWSGRPGIGKSSVVRAGLLPALRRGAVPGSERWFVATMVPGRDPFEELAAALLRVATKAPSDLMAQLVADRAGPGPRGQGGAARRRRRRRSCW